MIPETSEDRPGAPRRALVELAHEVRGKMTPGARIAGERKVLERLRRGSRRRPVLAVLGLVAAAALSAAAWVEVHAPRAARTLAYTVEGGRAGAHGIIEHESGAAPRLRFSDGSEILVGARAHAAIEAIDGHGASVALADGDLHFDVVHKPGATWRVDAGPYHLAVTGTAFAVRWEPTSGHLEVRMERGSVEVTGTALEDRVTLRAGQAFVVDGNDRTLMPVSSEARPAPTSGPAAEAPPTAAPAAPPVADAPPTSATTPARSVARPPKDPGAPRWRSTDWAAALAAGRFADILRDADARGIPTALALAGSGDLAALADAARFERRDDVARDALLEQRRRFPSAAPARDAAFLLGRIDEANGRRAGARAWYERYLAESPEGTYASEALGRTMTVIDGDSALEQKRAVARRYLARFPHGPYAAEARALSASP
jgi:TolA-binding protein